MAFFSCELLNSKDDNFLVHVSKAHWLTNKDSPSLAQASRLCYTTN